MRRFCLGNALGHDLMKKNWFCEFPSFKNSPFLSPCQNIILGCPNVTFPHEFEDPYIILAKLRIGERTPWFEQSLHIPCYIASRFWSASLQRGFQILKRIWRSLHNPCQFAIRPKCADSVLEMPWVTIWRKRIDFVNFRPLKTALFSPCQNLIWGIPKCQIPTRI
jgi:hypothetical protein